MEAAMRWILTHTAKGRLRTRRLNPAGFFGASVPRLNQKLTRSVSPPLGLLRTAGPDPPIQAHAFWEWSADLVGRIWRPTAVQTFFEGREGCRT
jgi:hypothetical protein